MGIDLPAQVGGLLVLGVFVLLWSFGRIGRHTADHFPVQPAGHGVRHLADVAAVCNDSHMASISLGRKVVLLKERFATR